MLKYLAILMMFIICTYIGFYVGDRYKGRSDSLSEIQKFLVLLNNEVIYINTALPEPLKNISNKISGDFSKVIYNMALSLEEGTVNSVYRCFTDNYNLYGLNMNLKESDFKILSDFFKALGETGVIGQEKILNLASESIKINSAEALSEYKINTKMYRTLGMCAGAVLAILFI